MKIEEYHTTQMRNVEFWKSEFDHLLKFGKFDNFMTVAGTNKNLHPEVFPLLIQDFINNLKRALLDKNVFVESISFQFEGMCFVINLPNFTIQKCEARMHGFVVNIKVIEFEQTSPVVTEFRLSDYLIQHKINQQKALAEKQADMVKDWE